METSIEVPGRQAAYTGILPYQAIREMVNNGEIKPLRFCRALEANQSPAGQHRSAAGYYAYPVDTSFLPGRGVRVLDKMQQLDEIFRNSRSICVTVPCSKRAASTLFPCWESIQLKSEVAAFAIPKAPPAGSTFSPFDC